MDTFSLTIAYFYLCYYYYYSLTVTAEFYELSINLHDLGAADDQGGWHSAVSYLSYSAGLDFSASKTFPDWFVWVSGCYLWYSGENLKVFKDDLLAVFLLYAVLFLSF